MAETAQPRRWGKAGQRLTDQEAAARARNAVGWRNRAKTRREADDAVAHRLWRAGELRPYRITIALDSRNLYGPEVDVACGAQEPDVDLWEAGKLYPTWEQLLLLAKLTGTTARFLCAKNPEPLRVEDTSLRFHGHRDPVEPLVLAFPAEVVAATVGTCSPVYDAPKES